MTTIDPARFLDREATMGSVEAGRNADLVLLAGNLIDSAANLHRVVGMVRSGRYFSQRELEAMSAAVAAKLQR